MSATAVADLPDAARYRVTGMDCASCAAKIEKRPAASPGSKT